MWVDGHRWEWSTFYAYSLMLTLCFSTLFLSSGPRSGSRELGRSSGLLAWCIHADLTDSAAAGLVLRRTLKWTPFLLGYPHPLAACLGGSTALVHRKTGREN